MKNPKQRIIGIKEGKKYQFKGLGNSFNKIREECKNKIIDDIYINKHIATLKVDISSRKGVVKRYSKQVDLSSKLV